MCVTNAQRGRRVRPDVRVTSYTCKKPRKKEFFVAQFRASNYWTGMCSGQGVLPAHTFQTERTIVSETLAPTYQSTRRHPRDHSAVQCSLCRALSAGKGSCSYYIRGRGCVGEAICPWNVWLRNVGKFVCKRENKQRKLHTESVEEQNEEGPINRSWHICVCICIHINIRNNNNNNIYLLQLGCHPVAVVILHVYKTWNWLLLNLSREGSMRSM